MSKNLKYISLVVHTTNNKSYKMDIDVILKDLDEVDEALKCGVCCKKCIDPVRVKVCGHYFCLKCLKRQDDAHFCPVCKAYYEEREVDYNTIVKQTASILSELRACFLKTYSKESEEPSLKTVPAAADQAKKDNIFDYNDKLYHMNYIDDLNNKVNAKGETLLHIACRKKNLDQVIQLIEKKVDLNVKDYAGWAPLHEAVESGRIEIVEVLLKHGALIDIPGPEYVTPLHKAVTLENEQIVRILLKYGANKEMIDYFGEKPEECTQSKLIKNIFSEKINSAERVEEIFCRKKICAYIYYIQDEYKDKLIKSKLVKIVKDFDSKKVSHFIMRKTHKLSVKILVALLEGCFLVPQEWIDDFLSNLYFIPIPDYTFISNAALNEGIKKALLNSLLKRPKLFDGILFYICGHNRPVNIYNAKFTKESIISVINAGGGKILHRAPTPAISEGVVNFPYHSNKKSHLARCCYYIIYEEENPPTLQYQMAEIRHKSSEWLIDCVINFAIDV